MTINAEIWLINCIKMCHELFIELKARQSICASLAFTDHECLGRCKIVYYMQRLSIAASCMRFARARNKI